MRERQEHFERWARRLQWLGLFLTSAAAVSTAKDWGIANAVSLGAAALSLFALVWNPNAVALRHREQRERYAKLDAEIEAEATTATPRPEQLIAWTRRASEIEGDDPVLFHYVAARAWNQYAAHVGAPVTISLSWWQIAVRNYVHGDAPPVTRLPSP